MVKLKKIVITGPESTGKSELSEALAKHFQVPWAPEYARIFLEKNGPDYNFQLLEKMALEHKEFQEAYLQKADNLVILDTDLINYQVWQKLVYGKFHASLQKLMKEEDDHLYLLSYPDIPWTPDPLRENPHDRMHIFEEHRTAIEEFRRPYEVVRGVGEERLKNSVKAVERLLKKGATDFTN